VEYEFYELRLLGILGSWTSTLRSPPKFAFREFSEIRSLLASYSDPCNAFRNAWETLGL
jgi:hypothetical protein